jgi:uracil-DNA glycosylase
VDKINKCELCPLADSKKIPYLASSQVYKQWPQKASDIKIVFVQDHPKDVDYLTDELLSDEAGAFLRLLIQENVPRETGFIILNAVNCVPWVNKDLKSMTKTPSMKECKTCSGNHLAYMLRSIKPRHVFALGQLASKTLKYLEVSHVELPSAHGIYYTKHRELEIKRFTINLRNALDAEKESSN